MKADSRMPTNSAFSVALNCTTRHWIPVQIKKHKKAIWSFSEGYRDGEADAHERQDEGGRPHADQIDIFHCLEL